MRASGFQRFTWLSCLGLGVLTACGGGGDGGGGSTPTGPVLVLTTMTVTLSSAALSAGQSGTAAVAGFDQNHGTIATGTVTWSSSSPNVATVDASGAIRAVAPGQTQIVATAKGIAGTAPLTVVPGGAATGVPLTLATAGQSTAFLDTPDPNVALTVPSGAQFLIAVVNTSASTSSREDFTLTGFTSAAPPGVAAAAIGNVPPPLAAGRDAAGFGFELPRDAKGRRLAAQTHVAILEDNRHIFASFGSAQAAWAKARAARASSARAAVAPIAQTVGTVNKVYVKRSLGGSCTAADSIGARTVAVGQHVIVLADTNTTTWPAALRPDSSFYQTFVTEYDQITFPHILAAIGDPLAFDGSLSSIGKITITITPVLNGFGSAGGSASAVAFVSGCDFFPFATTGPAADLSNQTEMFYSWIPGTNGFDVPSWQKSLRGTAAHETKHIVSFASRILNNSPALEETWLEEGLAQESSEIWERAFSQATWKGHANFLQTVACEINLGPNAPCDLTNDKPITMVVSHLPFLFDYLQTESSSHTEGLGLDTPANYGAGWTMARWATDQFATGTEAAFVKSLISEPRLSGLANISQHTGQSVASLLVYWNLATAIFQTPAYTASDLRTTIPSFDFANIFRVGQTGLTCNGVPCGLFTDSGNPVYPIQPTPLTAGAVSNAVTGVPGTSAAFFLLTGNTAATQQLHLVGGTGAALTAASALRVAILRVK